MEIKKGVLNKLIFLLFCIFLFTPLISAQSDLSDIAGSFFSEAKDFIVSGLSNLFGEREIATKSLFAILLFMVLYTTIAAAFKKKWLFNVLITGIVTALSIIWLPDNFLNAIRSQYGALGATILSIIPFVIVLIFTVKAESNLVGRILWLFYALYYMAVYVYAIAIEKTGWLSVENIPYFAAIIAGLVLFIGLPAVRNAIFKGQLKEIKEEGAKVASRAKVLHKLQREELKAYEDVSDTAS